jgi:branched-chain amino acid transport system ATP-binding protein
VSVLTVDKLVAGYDPGLPILRGAALSLQPQEVLVLLGPNGAGKSTLIKAIAGLVPIAAGHVHLEGKDITRLPAHRMVRHGLAFVPQTENVFAALTVAENLEVAAAVLPRPARPARRAAMLALFPDLAAARARPAGALSGGQRQMLAIARALVVAPRVLVLDEPSAGLSPKLVGQVMQKLLEIRAGGVSVLLVEQNARAALQLADYGYVLEMGRVALEGPAETLAQDNRVIETYLGRRRSEERATA